MFITKLTLENVRTFAEGEVPFIHPDTPFASGPGRTRGKLPQPRLPNVNLLLGDNGSGKSTILKMVALAAFGPAARESGLRDPGMIRREKASPGSRSARVAAAFLLHEHDRSPGATLGSNLTVKHKGELELIESGTDYSLGQWDPVYESNNDAFFVVGYGATRRVERPENFDMGARTKARFARAQRVASLFEDSFSLIPLTYWLPELKESNPGRYAEVVRLIGQLLGPGHYRFTEKVERGDYLFERGGVEIPFQSLSDGYRAFLGWVADLLYHLCYACPAGKGLSEVFGIVLVDEIDLHLHPKWQKEVIATVAGALPRMQFILTSHSPLVLGSLEWMNVVVLETGPKSNKTSVSRMKQSIHGLDVDQLLLTDYFGLKSTIAAAKKRQLDALVERIRAGDENAPLQLIREMATGTEAEG